MFKFCLHDRNSNPKPCLLSFSHELIIIYTPKVRKIFKKSKIFVEKAFLRFFSLYLIGR